MKPNMTTGKGLRCVIYTRKSTREGLAQDFNSLDAQRAACEAYVQSQAGERWTLDPTFYDDGGFSGASLERPALRRLIDDIANSQIDIVVVYKVDRLTRSLTDFSKLVEIFETRDVSFVSITQSFNTTTSMGRLTLNVLLSFAQFEREVTAERIRDKIRASKEKGMWMGGRPPLGYDIVDRRLIVNPSEAKRVQQIFECYLASGSVFELMHELKRRDVRNKRWTTKSGREAGGFQFSRGALYYLLQNPIYIGRIRHKDRNYEGQQEAIIEQALWEKVQAQLGDNRIERSAQSNAKSPSLLTGLMVNAQGVRFRPRHANRRGQRYRYYVAPDATLPAHEIETLVIAEISSLLEDQSTLVTILPAAKVSNLQAGLDKARDIGRELTSMPCRTILTRILSKVVIDLDRIDLHMDVDGLHALVSGLEANPLGNHRSDEGVHVISRTFQLKRSGHGKRIILGQSNDAESTRADPSLLRSLARAHCWFDDLKVGLSYKDIAIRDGIDQRLVARTIRLTFLAPDITEAILKGCEPQNLTAKRLLKIARLPADWSAQRELLRLV